MLSCREEVFTLTKQLVQMKSVVNTAGEREISHAIYSLISTFPYFRENPKHLQRQKTLHDDVERYNIVSFVKGKKNGGSNQTVILLGHIDTVGTGDFNHLEDMATDPDALKDTLRMEKVPDIVKKHVQSADFMFGRGSLDMKSGVASHLYLLKYYSEHLEELEGNLVCVFECDEEDSSRGILSAIKLLNSLKNEHHFDYAAAINADFVSPLYEGDDNRYIYKGTVGKLLPSFFITGAETHVGAPFEGLDPNYLAAELTKQISYNPKLCDVALGEKTMPPVSLKQMDFKPFYDVQTALSALVYFNFFTHSWSPLEVLTLLKHEAEIAFENALRDYNNRYLQYCQSTNLPYIEKHWEVRVLTYEEMNSLLENEHGYRYIKHMTTYKNQLLEDSALDTRMFAARVVEEAWKWMKDQRPAIILFYSSLYSPRVEVSGKNSQEEKLLLALEEAVGKVQPNYHYPIVTKNFFPYISDMSFVALSDSEEGIESIAANNPGWATKHFVNYDDIRELNVPIINIGPYGYDGHKKYERAEIEFSHYIVPNLTKLVIENVLADR